MSEDRELRKGSAELLILALLEERDRHGLIQGRWVEKNGERRRRFYRLTGHGAKTLAAQRRSWHTFFAALNRVARLRQA